MIIVTIVLGVLVISLSEVAGENNRDDRLQSPATLGLVGAELVVETAPTIEISYIEPIAKPDGLERNCPYWFAKVDEITQDETERAWLKRVMECESECRSGVVNGGGYTGLFQWSPYFWKKQFEEDIFDGEAQIKNSLYKYRVGGRGLWQCK